MKSLKEYFKARLLSSLSEDMAFDTAGMQASERKLANAENAFHKMSPQYMSDPNHPIRKKYDSELARHIAMGSADVVYTHDPATDQFHAIMQLPPGLSDALAADAMRFSNSRLTPAQMTAAVAAANALGGRGLHGVGGWEDPDISNKDMNFRVADRPLTDFIGRRITEPSRAARGLA